jgi:hypothetical protein
LQLLGAVDGSDLGAVVLRDLNSNDPNIGAGTIDENALARLDLGHSKKMQRIVAAGWNRRGLFKAHVDGFERDWPSGSQTLVFGVSTKSEARRGEDGVPDLESRDVLADGFDFPR